MTDNRRQTERFSIRTVDFMRLLVNNDFEVFGTMLNLGRGGFQFELFPTGPRTRPKNGDTLAVLSCEPELASVLETALGCVVWTEGDRIGVRFDHPLDVDELRLRTVLAMADISPWAASF